MNVTSIKHDADHLRIFFKPQPKRNYVIGGDVAQGLERGDASVLQVIEVESGRQVAEYFLPTATPPEVGEEAYKLGAYYNEAYIGIENNSDLTPLYKLHEMRYPNLHYQEELNALPSPTGTRKMGWNTNFSTRYVMVDDGRQFLKDGSVEVYSPWLLDEMEVFAQNARGKYEAIPGAHDDLVMAWLIAVQMWKIRLTRRRISEDLLMPLTSDGVPIAGESDVPLSLEERLVRKAYAEEVDDPERYSTVGALI